MSKITMIDEFGYKVWRNEEGQYHRVDEPAIIHVDGSEAWYINGLRHRLDGPAYIDADGYQSWWVDDKCHRIDGPAVIWTGGKQAWYINNIEVTREVYEWMEEMSIEPDYTKWTDTQKIMFRLAFSGISS